jgi:hypothetical protein
VDEFLQVQAEKKGPGVAGWWEAVLPQLSDEQRASLHDAAHTPSISHRTIGIVLGRWGFQVSAAQVGHWRRGYVG